MTAKVLIIDDEDLFREDLATLLRRRGHECKTASNAEEGLALAGDFGPDVILCDVVMPGRGGTDILDEIMAICPEGLVVMITAYGSLKTAVEAFRKGVSDYITKPLLVEDVLQKIQRLMDYKRLARELKLLRQEVSPDAESLAMVGQSEPMEGVADLVKKVAPTKSTVLITGESGTGKELVARAIHGMGSSSEHPFMAINCAGIPEHLLESELFGHVRVAFTGAIKDREGLFELAGEGTLFLDEIAEMPTTVQTKLLRVLEQKEFMRVGGANNIPLRARIIASTNRDLRELVKAEKFREDLFFRIAVFGIRLPALRERRSDIPLLTEYFVKKFNKELNRKCFGVDNEAMPRLLSYPWPGNVRELRNVIERAMIHCQGDYITLADLPPEMTNAFQFPKFSDGLRDAMRAYEKEHIRRVLLASSRNKEEAARRLGINPSTLYRKMADLSLDLKDASESPS